MSCSLELLFIIVLTKVLPVVLSNIEILALSK